MNSVNKQIPILDDEDWEASDNDCVENQLAAEAFAVEMGISIKGERVKPNHWLNEK